MTTITLTPELEQAVAEQARERATTLETLVLDTLREKFADNSHPQLHRVEAREVQPNAWESLILGLGFDAGVSLTDEQTGREVIYEDHD